MFSLSYHMVFKHLLKGYSNSFFPFLNLVAIVAIYISTLACNQAPIDQSITTVLSNATLIDGNGGTPLSNAVIALATDKIVYAGPKTGAPKAPMDAKTMDLTGLYIIPGLIDMHAHIDQGRHAPKFLAQLVAFGITTLRAPSNPVVELREQVRQGTIIGPDLYLAGKLINGPDSYFGQRGKTEEDYRNIVADDAKLGVEFVKIYAGVSPELVAIIIEEAHQHGLRVIGHLGETSWTQAAQAGIDALAHSWYAGLIHGLVPQEYREEFQHFYIPPGPAGFDANLFARWKEVVDIQGKEIKDLADLLVAKQIDVDPTLALGEAMTFGNNSSVLERLEPDLAMPGQVKRWRAGPHPYSAAWTEEQFAAAQEAWPLMLEIIRTFHERGVLLTAGSDLLNPWMTPGVSLHRELELLVSTGITPAEVLSIATRNGAKALGIEEVTGTIEVGKRADIIVLKADPTVSISNTRKIEHVFLAGKHYKPGALLQVQSKPSQ